MSKIPMFMLLWSCLFVASLGAQSEQIGAPAHAPLGGELQQPSLATIGVAGLLATARTQETEAKRKLEDTDVGARQESVGAAARRVTVTDTEISSLTAQLDSLIQRRRAEYQQYALAQAELARVRAVTAEVRRGLQAEYEKARSLVQSLEASYRALEKLDKGDQALEEARSLEPIRSPAVPKGRAGETKVGGLPVSPPERRKP
jgi:hypothetical protein